MAEKCTAGSIYVNDVVIFCYNDDVVLVLFQRRSSAQRTDVGYIFWKQDCDFLKPFYTATSVTFEVFVDCEW